MNHTLFPYYVRMYKLEQKKKMLAALCCGESVTLTSVWRSTTKKAWSLRYCPICVQEDIKNYGEPYWHREHQLPLAMVCCVHHCRLQSAGEPNPRLNETFYPLNTEHITDAVEPEKSWCETLSRVVIEYLTLPLEVGPTEGYSNLAQTLANNGYGVIKGSGITSLSAPRLYQDLIFFYGASFVKEMLGTEISAFVLNRIISWNLSSPERYALLQTFAGLSTETMFSLAPVEDYLYQALKELSESGVTYGKKELAEQLGLKTFQLDTLAKKYGIIPFWEQNKPAPEKRADVIKIYLTSKEHQEIHQAAKKLGFRYDNHFVKYCIELVLKKLD